MAIPIVSFEQVVATLTVERDWLFEKLLGKLGGNSNLILAAEQGWDLQEYVKELGFQLTEKNPDIQLCYIDIKPTHDVDSFVEGFVAALSKRFPEVTSRMDIDKNDLDTLKLPSLIAQKKKIRIVIFLSNCHLLHRYSDHLQFLRTLNKKLRNQKNVILCLYGYNFHYYRDMVNYPGPLSGLGQLFQLKQDPANHRSSSIRKLFHDHEKNIGFLTSVQMSYMVDNHPFYIRLLAWHALIRTTHTCTRDIAEKALRDLVFHFDYHFRRIADNLTSKQLNFLKALMVEQQGHYSKSIRDAYQLGSTSNIAREKQSLQNKGIIKEFKDTLKKNSYYTDPLFREWLRRCYFA